jgi:hypothetical protein
MMPIPWVPVYDHGCGWRDCPECGPLIEVEIQNKHERMVRKTLPALSQMSDWLAEVYGTGAERTRVVARDDRSRKALGERDRRREQIRVSRSIKWIDFEVVCKQLEARPVRKLFDRSDWANEVWLELLNPTKLVAIREKRISLKARVCKAIKRAEKRMWKEQSGNA